MSEQRQVWRIIWDGEPKMGGGYHVMAHSQEFDTRALTTSAFDILAQRGNKPNLRIQTRMVTDWEDAR